MQAKAGCWLCQVCGPLRESVVQTRMDTTCVEYFDLWGSLQHKSRAATTLLRFEELWETPQHDPRQTTCVKEPLEEAWTVSNVGEKVSENTSVGYIVLARSMESPDLVPTCTCL